MSSRFDKEDQGFTDVPKYSGVKWEDGNSSSTNINDIPPINADNLNKSENALRSFFGEENSSDAGYLQKVIDNQKSINSELHGKDNELENNISKHEGLTVSATSSNNPHGISKAAIGLGNVDNYSYDEIHTKLTADIVEDSNTNFVKSDLIYNSFVLPIENINAHQTICINNDNDSPVYEIKNIDLTINEETSHESTNNTNSTLTKVSYSVEKGQFDFAYKPIEIVTDQISNIKELCHTTTKADSDTATSASGTITSIEYEDNKFKVSSSPIKIFTSQVTDLDTYLSEHEASLADHEGRVSYLEDNAGIPENVVKYVDIVTLDCGSSTELVD